MGRQSAVAGLQPLATAGKQFEFSAAAANLRLSSLNESHRSGRECNRTVCISMPSYPQVTVFAALTADDRPQTVGETF